MPIRKVHLLFFLLSLNLCPGFSQADNSASETSILQEGWAQITGQDGEFSIMMPQPVDRQEKEKNGRQAIVYFSKAPSGMVLLLSRIIKPSDKPIPENLSEETSLSIVADGYTGKMAEEAKNENKGFRILQKVSKQIHGRAGLQLECETGSRQDCILITSSHTSFYVLHVIDTEKQPAESKLFIDSLQLFSKKQNSGHTTKSTQTGPNTVDLPEPAQPAPVPVLSAENLFQQGTLAKAEKVKLEGIVFELRPPAGLVMHKQAPESGKGLTAHWSNSEPEENTLELSITVYSSLNNPNNPSLAPDNVASWAVQKAQKGKKDEKSGSLIFTQPEKVWLNGREFLRHNYSHVAGEDINHTRGALMVTTVAGMAVIIQTQASDNDQKVQKVLEECLKTIKIQ